MFDFLLFCGFQVLCIIPYCKAQSEVIPIPDVRVSCSDSRRSCRGRGIGRDSHRTRVLLPISQEECLKDFRDRVL